MKFQLIAAILTIAVISISTSRDLHRVSRSSCPGGYVRHENRCYRLHNQLLSWPESITFCKALGSALLTIETASEHNFIKQKVNEVQGTFTRDSFWIAANDAVVENEFRWAESQTRLTYFAWAPGQPDRGREVCVALERGTGYNYGDYACDVKLHPICQVEVEPDNLIG